MTPDDDGRRTDVALRPGPLLTSRRHVDLLRTSSDLCPTR
jgi:hypothetical protein